MISEGVVQELSNLLLCVDAIGMLVIAVFILDSCLARYPDRIRTHLIDLGSSIYPFGFLLMLLYFGFFIGTPFGEDWIDRVRNVGFSPAAVFLACISGSTAIAIFVLSIYLKINPGNRALWILTGLVYTIQNVDVSIDPGILEVALALAGIFFVLGQLPSISANERIQMLFWFLFYSCILAFLYLFIAYFLTKTGRIRRATLYGYSCIGYIIMFVCAVCGTALVFIVFRYNR